MRTSWAMLFSGEPCWEWLQPGSGRCARNVPQYVEHSSAGLCWQVGPEDATALSRESCTCRPC